MGPARFFFLTTDAYPNPALGITIAKNASSLCAAREILMWALALASSVADQGHALRLERALSPSPRACRKAQSVADGGGEAWG